MYMRRVAVVVAIVLVAVNAQYHRQGRSANGTVWTTVALTTMPNSTATATTTDASTLLDSTTQDVTVTTEESRDNHRVHDFYLNKREKPQVSKITSNISQVSPDHGVQLNVR